MKKLFSLLLVLTLLFAVSACGTEKPETPSVPGASDNASDAITQAGNSGEPVTDAKGNVLPSNIPTSAVTAMPENFQPDQYVEYCDVFFNKQASSYAGKTVTKEGNFGILQDEYFGGGTRYYVWGYNDQTRCCDFQWEFVPTDVSSLPAPGSYIVVTGTTEENEAALDKFWIKDATVETKSDYPASEAYDYDLTTLSPTLARVQIINMINEKSRAAFEGKSVLVFGRALDATTIQHPYYNESWNLPFDADKESAIGTYLILGGTLQLQEDGNTHLLVDRYDEVG